jgi:LysM repeat protein
MDYPSAENVCYYVSPLATPSEAHQKKYCLEASHKICPLYEKSSSQAMPKEIAIAHKKRWFRFNFFQWILGITLFLITGLSYYYWPLIEANLFIPTVVPTGEPPVIAAVIPITGSNQEIEPTETIFPTQTDEPAPIDTISSTDVSESPIVATIQLTATELPASTPEPPHALQTPIGVENKFLIHRVLGGETLDWIAKNHGTTVDAIRAANFNMPANLWEGSKIIVPVDQTDSGEIIPMTAVEITGDGVSIESLAEDNQTNLMMLCQLNNRTHTYIFAPGEWVLIPHLVASTPQQAG